MMGNHHVRFGGGRTEKARHRDLAGRLPNYERPAWHQFLGDRGYLPFTPGCFVKELDPTGHDISQ